MYSSEETSGETSGKYLFSEVCMYVCHFVPLWNGIFFGLHNVNLKLTQNGECMYYLYLLSAPWSPTKAGTCLSLFPSLKRPPFLGGAPPDNIVISSVPATVGTPTPPTGSVLGPPSGVLVIAVFVFIY